ncbi:MAG: GNAT superfamily N-acetyltransferase [Moritella sp.]
MIREVTLADAAALAALFAQLDAETAFMAMGEHATAVGFEDYLPVFNHSSTQVFYVLEYENQLVGFAIAIAAYVTANPTALSVVMGVTQAHAGQGLGKQLLTQIEAWAIAFNFSYLELMVMVQNQRAISFYQHAGFEQQLLTLDRLIDEAEGNELYMVKVAV